MSEQLENPPEALPDQEPADLANAAVARCCNARSRILQACTEDEDSDLSESLDANEAYRLAMPPLSGAQNIRDFIACVAHGLIIGAFLESKAAKLLYAAQVAHCALPKGSPEPPRP